LPLSVARGCGQGRRVEIPKASGGKRPLSVGPPRDKIVQKALALTLETIYEPIFLNNSFGFRPKNGEHSALKELHLNGRNYS
jgi:retron-type reverse transcriptase